MTEQERRRFAVDFDPVHFAHRAADGEQLTPLETFRLIHDRNHWGSNASRSGPGSSSEQTSALQRELPALLQRLGVRSLLDLPCGDANWIAAIEFRGVSYLGADLVPEVIARNREAHPDRAFTVLDLTTDPLPSADLLLCRDCLVHLSFADITRALANIRRSSITWLLTTTFPAQQGNEDIVTGDWRPINLMRPPFNLPEPEFVLNEQCTENDGRFADKSLGLWKIQKLSADYADSTDSTVSKHREGR
jgi:SAM-dependent methyltransferase